MFSISRRESNADSTTNEEHDQSFEGQKDEPLYSDPSVGIYEYDDYLIINGERLDKPFLEKPVNAEDHEIIIYFSSHSACGAGYNVLFRKTNDYCSYFFPTAEGAQIRK